MCTISLIIRKSFASSRGIRRGHRASTLPPRGVDTASRGAASSDSADEMMSVSQRDDGEIDDDENLPSPPSPEELKEKEVDSVPDHKWECEHCTFVNKPGTRVCAVCCKTPTKNAIPIKAPNLRTKRNSFSRGSANSSVKSSKGTDSKKEENSENKNIKSDVEAKKAAIKFNQRPEATLNEAFVNQLNLSPKSQKKGMMRKISFWPGTKFYQ